MILYAIKLISCSVADAAEAGASRPRREKKEAFKIDFLTPAEDDLKARKNKLFAPVTRGAGITLPGPSSSRTTKKGRGRKAKGKDKEEKRNDQTLPDDMHFSAKQLVTLFLKPKFSVSPIATVRGRPKSLTPSDAEQLKMRGQRGRSDDGEINEAFWAQAAADQAGPSSNGADDSTRTSVLSHPTRLLTIL